MTEATRERSSIKFPYGALSDAEQVAHAVWKHGLDCSIDQLAAMMGQNLSGAFRNKVATASVFEVVETTRGRVTLTDLGQRLVDQQTQADARVEAFLNVPLYEQVYEAFRGRQLPSDQGLEAQMVKLGVSPKQASKARQAMYRSAEQAGFFLHGRERLVEPPRSRATVGEVRHVADSDSAQGTESASVSVVGVEAVRHPLIVGLWQMLPDPKTGQFTPEDQQAWLDAAKVNLKLLYGTGSGKTAGFAEVLSTRDQAPGETSDEG